MLTKKQLDTLRAQVASEGFDYVFSRSYRSFDDIKDPEFHILLKNYYRSISKIYEYLGLVADMVDDTQ